MGPPCTPFKDCGAPPRSLFPSPSSSSTTRAIARSKSSAVTLTSKRCPGYGCRISTSARWHRVTESKASASIAARISTRRCLRSSRQTYPCSSRFRSNERTHRIGSVPTDAGAIKFAEHRLETTAEFDEFHIARQQCSGVHVGHMAAARHAGEKYQLVPCCPIFLDVAVEVRGRASPVVEAVAAAFDPLAIHGRRIVVGLDEFDVHVAREAHRERHVRGRVAAAILRVRAG